MFRHHLFKIARFLQLVQQVEFTDTCWLWTGALMPQGYGAFHDKYVKAFNARWVLSKAGKATA